MKGLQSHVGCDVLHSLLPKLETVATTRGQQEEQMVNICSPSHALTPWGCKKIASNRCPCSLWKSGNRVKWPFIPRLSRLSGKRGPAPWNRIDYREVQWQHTIFGGWSKDNKYRITTQIYINLVRKPIFSSNQCHDVPNNWLISVYYWLTKTSITNIVYTNAHNPHISYMVYTMFPKVYYMFDFQYRIKDCVGPSLHGYLHYGCYVIFAKKKVALTCTLHTCHVIFRIQNVSWSCTLPVCI